MGFEKLVEFQRKLIDMGIPGNDCLVYHQGKEVFRNQEGYSDFESKTPMTGKERYYIYSCSKPITCTAALQLVEQGKLHLEDKLSDYLPEFQHMQVRQGEQMVPLRESITIAHLFTMTAGFNYNLNSPALQEARYETGGRCPTVETIRYLAKEPLVFQPSERWEYSLCHDVLAAVVELVSGIRFGEYVRMHIFDPLGMKHSTFLLPKEERSSICSQYYFLPDGKTRNKKNGKNDYILGELYESGGAGCVSTVEDYIKFLEALRMGDVILKKETIDQMTTDRLTSEQKKTYWVAGGYGYGLGVRCPTKESLVTDFGWGGAAGSYLAIDRKREYCIFYAQHVLSSPAQSIRSRFNNLVREIYSLT